MTHEQLRAIALEVAKETNLDIPESFIVDFALRFLAAVAEKAELEPAPLSAGHFKDALFEELLEWQQRRIAELEAQREGMVLVPMEPTEGIREVIRNEHGAYGSEDELYSALIAAATKED